MRTPSSSYALGRAICVLQQLDVNRRPQGIWFGSTDLTPDESRINLPPIIPALKSTLAGTLKQPRRRS